MRKISAKLIKDTVKQLVFKANISLRRDVLTALNKAQRQEKNRLSHKALSAVIENARIAKAENIAICQDTGFLIAFLEIGNEVQIEGNITKIITQAVESAYKAGYLRASIQKDPLFRKQKPGYKPFILHTDIVTGRKLKLTLLIKGFGSENKSRAKMFNPTASLNDVENFIVESVKKAGASACPPYVIGVGIGGTQDFACLLAKKSLLRSINKRNKKIKIAKLEKKLLKRINALKIGAFGFGGKTTALAVNIQTYSTHIAGLPVAVNISCHALRSASVVI